MNEFSHTDSQGRARMVDVGEKPVQHRTAVAQGLIRLKHETMQLIEQNEMKKGDVLRIAEFAGVSAAKKTSDLIPLCHPLLLTHVQVSAFLVADGVQIRSEVSCNGQTGVEMEALTAVQVALLTVYDMCKAVDKEMVIEQVSLVSKQKH